MPALCPELCQKSNAIGFLHQRFIAGLNPAIHLSSERLLRRWMDTRVKPAYDAILSDRNELASDER
jgi:hypothetical protein